MFPFPRPDQKVEEPEIRSEWHDAILARRLRKGGVMVDMDVVIVKTD